MNQLTTYLAPNSKWIANGPGYGGGSREKPHGQYGVAQLSPWLLFPLDGLNLKQGTSGEFFGYGYPARTPRLGGCAGGVRYSLAALPNGNRWTKEKAGPLHLSAPPPNQ